MDAELDTVVTFLTKFLHSKFPSSEVSAFRTQLSAALYQRYAGHWFPADPTHGCAYRALHSVEGRLDPLLKEVSKAVGLPIEAVLPRHLTVWCDPGEVSVRIGVQGSIWPLEMTAPA